MRRKDPLEPLVRVRHERVEKRTLEHGARVRESERRAAETRAAQVRRQAAEAEARSEQQRERSRLVAGSTRAADLQQVERYRVGTGARVNELARRERTASDIALAAAQSAEEARAALARARADERAVERHVECGRRDAERTREAAAEDAAAEFTNAVRHGARRS